MKAREVPLRSLYRRVDESGQPDLPLLSVYRDHGVVPRADRDDNHNRPSADLEAYKIVRRNDLVINKMKTWQGSLAVSRFEGIVSPAYFVCRRIADVDDRFMHHLLRSRPLIAEYGARSKGIRPSQWDLPWDEFASIKVRLPVLAEQRAIADYLDAETARIDALISKKHHLIDLLAEYRTALITQTVTKGLPPTAAQAANLPPNPPLKPTAIPWLGPIPTHWQLRQLKDVGTLIGGSGFPESLQDNPDEELPFFKVGDLSRSADGVRLTESDHTISRETARSLCARVIPPGAVAYAKIGAALLLNRRRIITRPSCIDNNMSAFVPDENRTSTRWTLYTLSLLDFGLHVNPGAVPSLSEGDQAFLHIPVPPLSEQHAITNYLDTETTRIDTLRSLVKTAINRLQEYRAALITAAVTGQIDVCI